jgi:RNA polymerase sigma-70 factor, ECF subfamily
MKDALPGPATVDRSVGDAITRAQRGDPAAFESLYKAHSRRVYSVCLRMIRNPADAEDLTQQAFLQVFRKIGTFRGESGFSTWLHRVTVNVVLMHLRRKKPTEPLAEHLERHDSSDESPRELGSGNPSIVGAIDRLNLVRAIRKLPSGYKQIFVLHDVMGYEHSEIATSLQCSIGNSRSQLHKARRQLRRLLQGEQGQPEHDPASAEGRDAATTEIRQRRHTEVTYRLSGAANAASGQRCGCD